MAIMAQSEDLRRQFSKEFRQEIVGLLSWLQRLSLVAGPNELHPAPPDGCDACGGKIFRSGFFVDGQMANGMWGNMCGRCFYEHGDGIGWGIGQLYWDVGQGRWRMIAGHEPDDL